MLKKKISKVFRRFFPSRLLNFRNRPSVGGIQFGSLRRLKPVSRVFGLDRGLPIDRYYIEQFLYSHSSDVKGHVLEIADDTYARKFGGDKVTKIDVLHAVDGNPKSTIVADLTCADNIQSNTFDAIILTQTLQFIYDVPAAIRTLHRILKPGGVLLATSSGISQISQYDSDRWGDYWRFTKQSIQKLFGEVFATENFTVETYGNVLASISFLNGLAAEELEKEELNYTDPDYQVLITFRGVKSEI